jgi:murein DD-endopeptidase MepM/ murein hydrolase activator NlpD
MPRRHLARRPSFSSPSGRSTLLSVLAVLVVLVALLPSATALGRDPRKDPLYGRSKHDPIRVAKEQSNRVQTRIESSQQSLQELTVTGEQLSVDLQSTTDQLNALSASLDDVQAQVESSEIDLANAEAEQVNLQQHINTLDWSMQLLSSQADDLASDLDQRRRQLGERLADAYRATQPELWEQVIGSSSFVSGIVAQQGSLALGQHDLQLAISIQSDQKVLDQERLHYRQGIYQTQQLRGQAAAQAVVLAADRDAQLKAEAQLSQMEAAKAALQTQQQAKYASVLENKAHVAALLKQQQTQQQNLLKRIKQMLQKERHKGALPSKFNGTFRWPLVAPISQEFGCTHFPLEPPRGSCDHFHIGIDIAGPSGAPIRAAGDGIIMWVGWDPDPTVPKPDASYYVMIAHDTHLVTIYGHLQPHSPSWEKIGAHVKEGQIIGWEGQTGNATGPHLHWGVMLNGEPVNPRFFL